MKQQSKKIITTFIAATSLTLLSGCQTIPYEGQARDVKLKPRKEGIVALPTNPRAEDRNKAQQKMLRNCSPQKYEIMEEGEVVIGQKTHSNSRNRNVAASETKIGSIFGVPVTSGDPGGQNTNSSAVTTSLKEWQISYKCLGSSNSNKKRGNKRM